MTDSELDVVLCALNEALRFFQYRDLMNATVHGQAPRYSPITDTVRRAYDLVERHLAPPGGAGDGKRA